MAIDDRTFRQKLNSRKLALTVGVIITSTALVLKGLLTGAEWVNVVSVISGAYMATQAWIDRGKQDAQVDTK